MFTKSFYFARQGLAKQESPSSSSRTFIQVIRRADPWLPRSDCSTPTWSQYCCTELKPGRQMKPQTEKSRHSCLRRILHICWPDTISNIKLWEIICQLPVEEEIRKRREGAGREGHALHKPPATITRQAFRWNPQGKRKRGHPRNTCRRDLEAEAKKMGYTWTHL